VFVWSDKPDRRVTPLETRAMVVWESELLVGRSDFCVERGGGSSTSLGPGGGVTETLDILVPATPNKIARATLSSQFRGSGGGGSVPLWFLLSTSDDDITSFLRELACAGVELGLVGVEII
jgi:hypothetical protein